MRTVWIARHMGYHVLIGVVYAWVLRELWQEFNAYYIVLAVFGSVIMDADHVLYWFVYGRKDPYARQIKEFLKQGKIRTVITFTSDNHKSNTDLLSHNIYVICFFLFLSGLSFFKDLETGVVLFGSMALHLVFDAIDDVLILGEMNKNWKNPRWKWWGKRK